MRIFCTEDAKARQIEERARGYMPAKIKRLLLVARNNEILQETALHALRSMPKNNK
jgi:hypothetical protein